MLSLIPVHEDGAEIWNIQQTSCSDSMILKGCFQSRQLCDSMIKGKVFEAGLS